VRRGEADHLLRDEADHLLRGVAEAVAAGRPVVVPEVLVCTLANIIGQIQAHLVASATLHWRSPTSHRPDPRHSDLLRLNPSHSSLLRWWFKAEVRRPLL